MSSSERPCYCQWGECETFYNQIRKLAPPQHVWNDKPVKIQCVVSKSTGSLTVASKARFRAILRHYKPINAEALSEQKSSEFWIYPHHFPQALLLWRTQNSSTRLSALLDRSDGHDWDGTVVRRGHRTIDYARYYPQTPMETRKAVESFVQSLQTASGIRKILSSPFTITTTESATDTPIQETVGSITGENVVRVLGSNDMQATATGNVATATFRSVAETTVGEDSHHASATGKRQKISQQVFSPQESRLTNADPPVPQNDEEDGDVPTPPDSACRAEELDALEAVAAQAPSESHAPQCNDGFDVSSLYAPLHVCQATMAEFFPLFLSRHSNDEELSELFQQAHESPANRQSASAWDTISRKFKLFQAEAIHKICILLMCCHESYQCFRLYDGVWFCPCIGVDSLVVGTPYAASFNCEGFTLRTLAWDNQEVLCGACTAFQEAEARRNKPKQIAADSM